MNINPISKLKGQLQNKIVILRVDFNVPVFEKKIIDYTRIFSCIDSIKFLVQELAKVVIITHFGRPNGADQSLSTSFLAQELSTILQKKVYFSPECYGMHTRSMIHHMQDGDILLLENIRFDVREENNDIIFAQELASLGDIYINEAFSVSHREHASVSNITNFIPSYAGFLFCQEIQHLEEIKNAESSTALAIIGGRKISTKFKILEQLTQRMSKTVVGGAMAHTLLMASGYNIGRSFYEPELLERSKILISNNAGNIVLPSDCICSKSITSNDFIIRSIDQVQDDEMILDIGPATVFRICEIIDKMNLVFWNGPLGMIENLLYSHGSITIARFLAANTISKKCKTIAGGGDTIAALNLSHVISNFNYVSTAGGAFLEFLEGTILPGIVYLEKNSILN